MILLLLSIFMLSDRIRRLLGFPDNMISKMDQNEAPYPPPHYIFSSLQDALESINYYQTDKLYDEVCSLYAEYAGCSADRVFLAPGADNFYDEFFYHYRKSGIVVAPRPTYFLFEEQATHLNYKVIGPKLRPDEFKLDTDTVIEAAREADFIYIDNPNNPTGALISEVDDLRAVAEETDKALLVDEAYYEFMEGDSIINLVEDYSNLAVLRTMSKAFCLAGLRITILIAGDDIKRQIYKKILKFRVPTPSLVVARDALLNRDYVEKIVEEIRRERRRLIRELNRLGLKAYNSHTNFILVKTNGEKLVSLLRNRGIYVKDVSNQLNDYYMRITVGDKESNDLLIRTLEELLDA